MGPSKGPFIPGVQCQHPFLVMFPANRKANSIPPLNKTDAIGSGTRACTIQQSLSQGMPRHVSKTWICTVRNNSNHQNRGSS